MALRYSAMASSNWFLALAVRSAEVDVGSARQPDAAPGLFGNSRLFLPGSPGIDP